MRGLGRFQDLCPAESVVVIILGHRSSMFQGGDDIFPFLVRQEMRRLG